MSRSEITIYKNVSKNEIDNLLNVSGMLDTKKSYVFKQGLLFSDYDFTKKCKEVLDSIGNCYNNIDNMSGAISVILTSVKNIKLDKNKIDSLSEYLVNWFRKVNASNGVAKTATISVLMWLKNYDFIIDLESIWIFGNSLNKQSMLFLGMLVELFGVSVNVIDDTKIGEMGVSKALRNACVAFKETDEKLGVAVQNSLMSTSSLDYTFYHIERTNSKDLDELLLQADSKLKIGAFVFGYDEALKVDIHNSFVKLTEFMGGVSIQNQVQNEIESIEHNSFMNKQLIDKIKLGFEQRALNELMELSESMRELEVKRTSYFFSERITDVKYKNAFRYTIDTIFNNKDANIRQLYTVCITVVAMLNTSKINSISNNLLYYNKKKLSLAECAWLFIQSSVTDRVVIFDVTKGRLYELMQYLGVKKEGVNMAYEKAGVAVNNNIFSLIEFNSVGTGEVLNIPVGLIKTKIKTAASKAQDKMNSILYGDNTIVQSDKIESIDVNILSSTLTEIPIVWIAENQARPGFKLEESGRKAVVSTLLANITGVDDKEAYTNRLKQLADNANTEFFYNKHFVEYAVVNNYYTPSSGYGEHRDITNDSEECAGTFNILQSNMGYDGKVLNRDAVMRSWKFRVLNYDIQNFLTDKIEALCSSVHTDMLNVTVQDALKAVANFPSILVKRLVAYEFSGVAPKIIMVFTGNDALSLFDGIMLYFCSLCGFDVLVFASNGYRGLDGVLRDNIFDSHVCGKPSFNYDFNSANRENRRGFFAGLFV